MKTKVICIGGAPSSGSTLLANLLDSCEAIICPPELYLYSCPNALRFNQNFKDKAILRIPIQPKGIYVAPRPFFNEHHLAKMGLTREDLIGLISRSCNLEEFLVALLKQQNRHRNKSACVFCDATPININEARNFCNTIKDGLFIHIVRDIHTTIQSLKKRGFSYYESVLIWSYQNLAGLEARTAPNYLRIHYEDLIDRPYDTAAEIAEKIGCDEKAAIIEKRFSENTYRYTLSTPKTWNVQSRADIQPRPLDRNLETSLAPLSKLTVSISHNGQTKKTSINELLLILGYESLTQEEHTPDSDLHSWLNESQHEYFQSSSNIWHQRNVKIELTSDRSGFSLHRKESKNHRRLRVLHGVSGQANQPYTLARALAARGHYADSCSIANHPFQYNTTYNIRPPRAGKFGDQTAYLSQLIDHYDIFHFHARSFYSPMGHLNYPSLLDMIWLKSIGKKVFFHYRGSEIRNEKKFRNKNTFSFSENEVEARKIFNDFPPKNKVWLKRIVSAVCDGIFVVDDELKEHVGHDCIIVPRAVDSTFLEATPHQMKTSVTIVHAPSRAEVKGSPFLISAVKKLQSEGFSCELKLLQGVPHNKVIEECRKADIVVDQLRLGWYGVFSIEALALGKPVICYVRPDISSLDSGNIPIVNATPDNIYHVLKDLINDPDKRQILGRKGRAYFERVHDADQVAAKLEKFYALCSKAPEEVDWSIIGRFLDYTLEQTNLKSSRRAKNKKTIKHIRNKIKNLLRPY